MTEHQITDAAALDRAFTAPRFLLLKHSERCGISRSAFAAYAAFVEAHPDVRHGWIEVREHRDLSNATTARTGIKHSSPQAVWLIDGTPTWHATHFDITADALDGAVTPNRG